MAGSTPDPPLKAFLCVFLFSGTGCSSAGIVHLTGEHFGIITKQHVRRYLSITLMKGLDEKQTLLAFPFSLTGGASRWYHSLDPSKIKVWNGLVELFVDQLIFNTIIDVTLRDLETTK